MAQQKSHRGELSKTPASVVQEVKPRKQQRNSIASKRRASVYRWFATLSAPDREKLLGASVAKFEKELFTAYKAGLSNVTGRDCTFLNRLLAARPSRTPKTERFRTEYYPVLKCFQKKCYADNAVLLTYAELAEYLQFRFSHKMSVAHLRHQMMALDRLEFELHYLAEHMIEEYTETWVEQAEMLQLDEMLHITPAELRKLVEAITDTTDTVAPNSSPETVPESVSVTPAASTRIQTRRNTTSLPHIRRTKADV